MNEILKPRAFGELFSQTFSLSLKALGKLLAIQLVFWVPFAILGAGVMFLAVGELDDVNLEEVPPLVVIVPALLLVLFVLILSPVPNAASVLVIADRFTGRATPIRVALGFALRRLARLLLLGCAVSLVLLLPLFPGLVVLASGAAIADNALLALGGVLLLCGSPFAFLVWLMFSVAVPALLVEDLSVREAMARSRGLTVNYRLNILGLFLSVGLVIGILSGVLEGLIGLATSPVESRVLKAVLDVAAGFPGQLLSAAVSSVVVVVIYFDLRVRKDAFDLDHLAEFVDVIARREGRGAGTRDLADESALVDDSLRD